jgi:hypothetical protein
LGSVVAQQLFRGIKLECGLPLCGLLLLFGLLLLLML